MTDIISAIVAIKSDAQVSVYDEDINKITWHDGNPTKITNKQITDKQAELQTIDGWKTTIKAVKDKYPKG